MALTSNIYTAFCQQVKEFASTGGRSLAVSYPASHFTPPDSGLWLQIVPFWNEGREYGLARNGLKVEEGFFRVIVLSRLGAGLGPAQDVAEELIKHFPKGSAFGGAVTDTRPRLSGPLIDDDKIAIPLTVRWRAAR